MATTSHTVRARRAIADGVVKDVDAVIGQSDGILTTIPVTALRGPTGLILTATEAAGGFNLVVSTNVFLAQAEVTDNETETSVCLASVVLPPEYVPGSDLTVRLPVAVVKTGSATDNASTIDLSVYRQASGAVGSDLCTTAAQAFVAVDTWYNKDFTVDGATLAPGDVLVLKITSNIVDSEAGAGTLRLNLDAISLLGHRLA